SETPAKTEGGRAVRIPMTDVILVHEKSPPEALQLAIDAFAKRVAFLGGKPLEMRSVDSPSSDDRNRQNLSVIGSPDSNGLVKEMQGPALTESFAAAPDWVQQQSFQIDVFRNAQAAEKFRVLAGSLGPMGKVYAISDLEMRLASLDGKAY